MLFLLQLQLSSDSSRPCVSSAGGRVVAASTVLLFFSLPVPFVIRGNAVVYSNCRKAVRPFFLCTSPYHRHRVRCSSIRQCAHMIQTNIHSGTPPNRMHCGSHCGPRRSESAPGEIRYSSVRFSIDHPVCPELSGSSYWLMYRGLFCSKRASVRS